MLSSPEASELKEGVSPGQVAKAPADLRSLARSHTKLSVETLAGIARNGTSEQARVSAAQALLDRGWAVRLKSTAGHHPADHRF